MIIDAHIHFGNMVSMRMKTSETQLIREMDRNNIEKAICMHIEGIRYDMCEGNRKTHELMCKFPDRIQGYCSVISARLDKEEVVSEIFRCVSDYGMVGIKLYSQAKPGSFTSWIPANNPLLYPVIDEIKDLEVPILAHASPEEIEGLASEFPDVVFIMAHMGNTPTAGGTWHRAIQVAKNYKNVYLETCSSVTEIDCFELAIAELGAEKIIYGSDWPLFSFEFALAKINTLDLSPQQQTAILGENIRGLMPLLK